MLFYIKLVKLTQKQYVHFFGWMEEFYVSFVYGSVNFCSLHLLQGENVAPTIFFNEAVVRYEGMICFL